MPADLAALDALWKAATPGPLFVHRNSLVVDGENLLVADCPIAADAALIAALHNAWPELRVAVEVANAALVVEDTWNAYEATDKLGVREATEAAKKYEAACEALDAARARLRALREAPDAA